jgi:hypothetical protein
MSYVTGVVYRPPVTGIPFLAALFGEGGELLLVRPVESIEAGESLLEAITEECHELRFPEPDTPNQANDP